MRCSRLIAALPFSLVIAATDSVRRSWIFTSRSPVVLLASATRDVPVKFAWSYAA